jgi:hypothetical protein
VRPRARRVGAIAPRSNRGSTARKNAYSARSTGRSIDRAIDARSTDRRSIDGGDRRVIDRSTTPAIDPFDRTRATSGAARQGATTTTTTMSHQDWKEITIGKRATSGTSGTSAKAMKDPKAVAAVRERRERANDARMNACARE